MLRWTSVVECRGPGRTGPIKDARGWFYRWCLFHSSGWICSLDIFCWELLEACGQQLRRLYEDSQPVESNADWLQWIGFRVVESRPSDDQGLVLLRWKERVIKRLWRCRVGNLGRESEIQNSRLSFDSLRVPQCSTATLTWHFKRFLSLCTLISPWKKQSLLEKYNTSLGQFMQISSPYRVIPMHIPISHYVPVGTHLFKVGDKTRTRPKTSTHFSSILVRFLPISWITF